jgi:hypothetical protein
LERRYLQEPTNRFRQGSDVSNGALVRNDRLRQSQALAFHRRQPNPHFMFTILHRCNSLEAVVVVFFVVFFVKQRRQH